MCRLIGMYIHQKGTVDEKLDRMFLFSLWIIRMLIIRLLLSYIVAFKVYDLDGNGFIEREELMKLAGAIHKYVDLSQQHKKNKGKTMFYSHAAALLLISPFQAKLLRSVSITCWIWWIRTRMARSRSRSSVMVLRRTLKLLRASRAAFSVSSKVRLI